MAGSKIFGEWAQGSAIPRRQFALFACIGGDRGSPLVQFSLLLPIPLSLLSIFTYVMKCTLFFSTFVREELWVNEVVWVYSISIISI